MLTGVTDSGDNKTKGVGVEKNSRANRPDWGAQGKGGGGPIAGVLVVFRGAGVEVENKNGGQSLRIVGKKWMRGKGGGKDRTSVGVETKI